MRFFFFVGLVRLAALHLTMRFSHFVSSTFRFSKQYFVFRLSVGHSSVSKTVDSLPWVESRFYALDMQEIGFYNAGTHLLNYTASGRRRLLLAFL